jgi:hypothetical protein
MAAIHHLPLYEALHLAGSFRLATNKEEEPVIKERLAA